MTAGAPPTRPGVPGTPQPSAYRAALNATAEVIQRRARYFRNLVVAVVLLGVGSVASTLVTRSPLGLAGFLLLVPACGLFFVADSESLGDWRSTLLAGWARRELDFSAFRAALRAHPSLPTQTTEAMLATLPAAGELVAERQVLSPTRRALAAAVHTAHRERADALLLNTLASVIAAGSVVSALSARSWRPLLALVALALMPLAGVVLRHRRRTARDAAVAASRGEAGFDEEAYARLLATLG